MAQKMQTYDEISITKVTLEYHRNPNCLPQEFQDYVLCSPNVEHNCL